MRGLSVDFACQRPLVGSYPQPEWLIDRPELAKTVVRVRADHVWAHAAGVARTGTGRRHPALPCVTRKGRASISFPMASRAASVIPITLRKNSTASISTTPDIRPTVSARLIPVPRIFDKIRRKGDIEVHPVKVVRANTDRMVKATVPGPFTMAVQAKDELCNDEEAVAFAYADVVNQEIKSCGAPPALTWSSSTSRG